MTPVADEALALPASLGQERHWAYQQRFPRSAAFNVPVAAALRGDIDTGLLVEAVRRVVARHECLSATFRQGARYLLHVPHHADAVPVTRHDLTSLDRVDRTTALAAIGAEEAARPFDIAAEPASRAHLVRVAADEVVLVLNVHHVSFDGWSSPVFFADLADQYQALSHGAAPRRAEPSHRYVDFARWQRKRLRTGGFADQLGYWEAELATPVPAARWPGRADRGPGQADRCPPWWTGDMVWLDPPADLMQAALAAARQHRTSFFTWALAAYQVAMHEFLDADEVSVGTPFTARTDARWHEVVGFFANTVVMRSSADPTQSFRGLVESTHRRAVQAHEHQDLPFGVLLDRLQPPVEPDRTPLFQHMLIVQNTPLPDPAFDAARLRTTKLVTGSARYDMTFCLGWRDGRLALELETRPALLPQAEAIRFARLFFGVLAASVRQPDERIGRMDRIDVPVVVHRRVDPRSGTGGLFDGLVGDWRPFTAEPAQPDQPTEPAVRPDGPEPAHPAASPQRPGAS